ncbi:hypothetical protein cyc_00036 [Cyclospora cayetanensis]|uniref:Uncharacterized protein n=1 Tax=Cyclospora cayetanensis TaxID=88456 RepID=A0A1D3CSI2_9EIME|nr:hypothetical protein cyc_00036 [Cyclospora cayetanensis]
MVMAPFGRALAYASLHLLPHCATAISTGGEPVLEPVRLVTSDSFDELFGGTTVKATGLGSCDKYTIQVGPSSEIYEDVRLSASSSVRVVMDKRAGIIVEYTDDDIMVVQTGDIGKDIEAGPFMHFVTKGNDRFIIQSYFQDSSSDLSPSMGRPHLVYFEGNVAGKSLEWPGCFENSGCSAVCKSGQLQDAETSV